MTLHSRTEHAQRRAVHTMQQYPKSSKHIDRVPTEQYPEQYPQSTHRAVNTSSESTERLKPLVKVQIYLVCTALFSVCFLFHDGAATMTAVNPCTPYGCRLNKALEVQHRWI
eukprot:1143698-Pelagomonas_calceolata.AAC.2